MIIELHVLSQAKGSRKFNDTFDKVIKLATGKSWSALKANRQRLKLYGFFAEIRVTVKPGVKLPFCALLFIKHGTRNRTVRLHFGPLHWGWQTSSQAANVSNTKLSDKYDAAMACRHHVCVCVRVCVMGVCLLSCYSWTTAANVALAVAVKINCLLSESHLL